jgi:hypothetical protein
MLLQNNCMTETVIKVAKHSETIIWAGPLVMKSSCNHDVLLCIETTYTGLFCECNPLKTCGI